MTQNTSLTPSQRAKISLAFEQILSNANYSRKETLDLFCNPDFKGTPGLTREEVQDMLAPSTTLPSPERLKEVDILSRLNAVSKADTSHYGGPIRHYVDPVQYPNDGPITPKSDPRMLPLEAFRL